MIISQELFHLKRLFDSSFLLIANDCLVVLFLVALLRNVRRSVFAIALRKHAHATYSDFSRL